MLHLPIRSGKTMIASILCWKTGVRALMVVPSTLLMAQTADVLRRNLPDAPVGIVGDGTWDPQYITVATIQTLLARPQEAKELLSNVGLLIQDEGHHLEGEAWRRPIIESDAYYKVGLSATIFANPDIPAERSAIWMKASVGPIRHKVSMKFMFDRGYLVPPVIAVYPVRKPDGYERVGYSTAYKQLVAESEYRNAAIAELGEQAALAGYRVLVDTGRRKQLARIEEMLSARDIATLGMHGGTPLAKRQRGLRDFKAKKVHAVVGTVLGEGVDIPELEVVDQRRGAVLQDGGAPAHAQPDPVGGEGQRVHDRLLRPHPPEAGGAQQGAHASSTRASAASPSSTARCVVTASSSTPIASGRRAPEGHERTAHLRAPAGSVTPTERPQRWNDHELYCQRCGPESGPRARAAKKKPGRARSARSAPSACRRRRSGGFDDAEAEAARARVLVGGLHAPVRLRVRNRGAEGLRAQSVCSARSPTRTSDG
jgi:hypothetical protein